MPTIRTFGPAARRSRLASAVTFVRSWPIAPATHVIALAGSLTQLVTSLPPIETVIRPTFARFFLRNASAAWSCVLPS